MADVPTADLRGPTGAETPTRWVVAVAPSAADAGVTDAEAVVAFARTPDQ